MVTNRARRQAETGSQAAPEAPSGLRPSGFDPARKSWRCRLGFHDWKLSNGVGYTRDTERSGSRMVILYDKDCRRCGKHEGGGMVV